MFCAVNIRLTVYTDNVTFCYASVPLCNNRSSLCFADEHDAVQKKTFTKWINAQLSKVTFLQSDDGFTCVLLFFCVKYSRLI